MANDAVNVDHIYDHFQELQRETQVKDISYCISCRSNNILITNMYVKYVVSFTKYTENRTTNERDDLATPITFCRTEWGLVLRERLSGEALQLFKVCKTPVPGQ
jgi:hypothetical protein